MTLTNLLFFFFFNDTATTEIYTLSLHDALPIFGFRHARLRLLPRSFCPARRVHRRRATSVRGAPSMNAPGRSEEHTSELQSPCNLVCRLLLEKKKKDIHLVFCFETYIIIIEILL